MTHEAWFAFLAMSAVVIAVPGPTVLMVVSRGLAQGLRAAVPTALGVASGHLTAISVAILALNAVLAVSPSVFMALRFGGAVYLVWLGWLLWQSGRKVTVAAVAERLPAGRMVRIAWAISAMNPATMTFFLAFLPQFLDPAKTLETQSGVLAATFASLSFTNALCYGIIAGQSRRFVASVIVVGWFNKLAATLLVAGGILAAISAFT